MNERQVRSLEFGGGVWAERTDISPLRALRVQGRSGQEPSPRVLTSVEVETP